MTKNLVIDCPFWIFFFCRFVRTYLEKGIYFVNCIAFIISATLEMEKNSFRGKSTSTLTKIENRPQL